MLVPAVSRLIVPGISKWIGALAGVGVEAGPVATPTFVGSAELPNGFPNASSDCRVRLRSARSLLLSLFELSELAKIFQLNPGLFTSTVVTRQDASRGL